MTGIWHGANWTFVVWGLLYFILLVFEKISGIHKSTKLKPLRFVYTIFFVIMGWVIFRATSIENAFDYIGAMFGSTGALVDNTALFYLKENAICFILSIVASTPLLKWVCEKYLSNKTGNIITPIILIAILLISVIYIVKGTYNPFIYFNF